MDYSLVIWDWNGTLIDDFGASLSAVNDMLARRGKQPITAEQYYEYIDTPIIRFYEHILDPDELDMGVIVPEFNQAYFDHLPKMPLMDGAIEALDYFASKGTKQIILSATSSGILEAETRRMGIRDRFDKVVGADDELVTGKIEKGVEYINKNSINKSQAVLIGDTLHDCEAANAAGIKCFLIPCGHQSRSDLETSGCCIYSSLRSLVTILKSSD